MTQFSCLALLFRRLCGCLHVCVQGLVISSSVYGCRLIEVTNDLFILFHIRVFKMFIWHSFVALNK